MGTATLVLVTGRSVSVRVLGRGCRLDTFLNGLSLRPYYFCTGVVSSSESPPSTFFMKLIMREQPLPMLLIFKLELSAGSLFHLTQSDLVPLKWSNFTSQLPHLLSTGLLVMSASSFIFCCISCLSNIFLSLLMSNFTQSLSAFMNNLELK